MKKELAMQINAESLAKLKAELGIEKQQIGELVLENLHRVPFTDFLTGVNSQRIFTIRNGRDWTYMVLADFVCLIIDCGNMLLVNDITRIIEPIKKAEDIRKILDGDIGAIIDLSYYSNEFNQEAACLS